MSATAQKAARREVDNALGNLDRAEADSGAPRITTLRATAPAYRDVQQAWEVFAAAFAEDRHIQRAATWASMYAGWRAGYLERLIEELTGL